MKYYLSQSALQAFEKCPRKYYYYNIMRFLGEKPFIMPMDFGITIHNLIEESFQTPKSDREEVIKNKLYEKVIEVEDDSKRDYEGRLMKLVKPLSQICRTIDISDTELYVSSKVFDTKELSQEAIDAIIRTQQIRGKGGGLEGVWFGGFIDAIGIMDGKKTVIDWKTGKFSRMWIGQYERQLQLYTHLMRLNGEYINQAKIIYVEQNGFEHQVDTSVEKCDGEFEKMKSKFKQILELGDFIENFEMIDDEIECGSCAYNFICFE